jgi:hypothetical protein
MHAVALHARQTGRQIHLQYQRRASISVRTNTVT